MPKVKIYTTATCKFCGAEKEFLAEHNIAFEEVAVDTDQKAAEEMVKASGQLAVPFTVIQKNDGSEEHILGFDQQRLSQALGI
ncbi:MAG TPA: glutaredoxin family protein [Candidatus Dormibacteraeota bacterium]|nr:glutaredoxin family protein [Candidatus Dormibacteraeota bacterium]